MTRRAQPPRQRGATLMELATVFAIVSVLAMATLPSIVDRWQREVVIVLADRFASAVSLARATAVRRHVCTRIGPRDAALGWAGGWKLTMTRGQCTPGMASATADEVLLSVSPPMLPAVEFSFPLLDKGGGTLSYGPMGYSRQGNGAKLHDTLTITSGRHVRRVRLNSVGRPRICDPDTDRRSCTVGGTDEPDDDPAP